MTVYSTILNAPPNGGNFLVGDIMTCPATAPIQCWTYCGMNVWAPSPTRVIWQSGIPFVLPGGDGATNGLSFTGTRGVFTLSSAILAGVYAMLGGCYLYLPAGAGGLSSSGWYWATFSDDTNGEVFANTFTPAPGAIPPLVSSPNQQPNLTSGRITQTVSDVTAVSATLSGGSMGLNGTLRLAWKQVGTNSASSKRASWKLAGSDMAYMNFSTSYLDSDKEAFVQNAGLQDRQIATRKNEGIGGNNTSYSSDHSSIDTSVDQTLTATLGLTSNVDSMIMIPRLATVTYGA